MKQLCSFPFKCFVKFVIKVILQSQANKHICPVLVAALDIRNAKYIDLVLALG